MQEYKNYAEPAFCVESIYENIHLLISSSILAKMWCWNSFTSVLCMLAFISSAICSPILDERAVSRCTARDLAIVRRTVASPVYFCNGGSKSKLVAYN